MMASSLPSPERAERVAAETAELSRRDGGLRGAALLRRLRAVYETSGACGARIHSQTSACVRSDGGVEFVLRVLPSLRAKPQGGAAGGAGGGGGRGGGTAAPPPPPANNPFLPYDERLFVANLSPTHVLLLNKFDVVPYHSLVVTRAFEPQTDPLRAADLRATWAAMAALAGGGEEGRGALAFYNCGEHSGRSQPHKHAQVVPLPFFREEEEVVEEEGGGQGQKEEKEEEEGRGRRRRQRAEAPIAAIVERALAAEQQAEGPVVAELRELPFRAYAVRAPPLLPEAPTTTTAGGRSDGGEDQEDAVVFAALERALALMVSRCAADCAPADPAASYNLLLADGWAVAVPRRSERDRAGGGDPAGSSSSSASAAAVSVAVNALGFAGTLLCKSDAELAHAAREKGPMAVLADVGWPW